MSIEVVAYDPAWPARFEVLKARFEQQLGALIEGVEHVGSTSVPGLAAKPIVDIDLVIADADKLPAVTAALEKMGYRALGDLGIADRYAFRPVGEPAQSWPRHNLYCCPRNGMGLRNHLALRNALRNDPDLCRAYAALKRELALHITDIDVYAERKSAFISQVLLANGFSTTEAAAIVQQNKAR